MLVVIGITMLLSSIAIGYSKIGQNEVALTVETSKVAELILQAKELSINTYGLTESGAKACAFGVHFDVAAKLFAFCLHLQRCALSVDCEHNSEHIQLRRPWHRSGISAWQLEYPIAQGFRWTAPIFPMCFSILLFHNAHQPNAGDQFAPLRWSRRSTFPPRRPQFVGHYHKSRGQVSF